jgi:DNA replication protein DnaC
VTSPVADPHCPRCRGSGWVKVADGGAGAATPCECRQAHRVPALLAAAGIPDRYRNCSFESFAVEDRDPLQASALRSALLQCRRYVENFFQADENDRGRGLIFIGPTGTGKTHLAAATLVELVQRYARRGMFTDFTSLIYRIQSTFNADSPQSQHDVLDPVIRAEVLVLDELGASRASAFADDTLYLLLNDRYTARRPTIFTSNYRLVEKPHKGISEHELLASRIKPRLVSRLYEMAEVVTLDVEDYRKRWRGVRTGLPR